MANSYKNIVITPNIGSTTADPKIQFSGGNTTINTDISMFVYPNSNGTLSFEGSAGQLFSITNDLTGSIFSVNDVSGIPSLEVFANGQINLAQYGGNVVFGNTSSITAPIFYDSANPSFFLDPNSTSFLSQARFNGRISIGDGNGTPFLNTGTPGFWLSYNGASNIFIGAESTTSWGAFIGDWRFTVNSSGVASASGDMRAPIFYDNNNTAYYIDPSSSTQSAHLNGKIQLNATASVYLINQLIDARNVWEGTLNGYLLLAKAYVSGFQENSEVLGTIFISRGNTSAGNRQETIFVRSKSAYNAESFVASWPAGRDFSVGTLHKVTYNGTVYHAIRLAQSGGGPTQAFSFTGHAQNAGLIVALDSEVSNVSSYGNVLYETFTDGTFRVKTSLQAPIFYDSDDTAFYLDPASTTTSLQIAGAIEHGNNFAHPNIEWSASGTSTGMVIFSLPGVTPTNYGMLHMVFDIYEYISGKTSTVIVGGHNWQGNWYANGCQVIGNFDKTVRLGVKDSKWCVVFGGAASTWEYATIRLRKIHNGSYYNNNTNLGGAYTVAQTTTESFTTVTADLRQLRTSGTFQADGDVRAPIFYDLNNTAFYVDPASGSSIKRLFVDGTSVDPSEVSGAALGTINEPTTGWSAPGIAFGSGAGSHGAIAYGAGNMYFGSENGSDNTMATRMSLTSGGILSVTTDVRAPIFYDTNNTAYFTDPASTSNLNGLTVAATITGKIQYVTEGMALNADNYMNFRVMRNNNSTTSNDGMYIGYGNTNSGLTRIFGGGATTGELIKYAAYTLEPGSFRAPIFYDSNNTAFYADPATTSVFNALNLTTLNGNPASELVWRTTSPYLWDSVNAVINYYWVRIGRIGITGANAYGTCQIEIECKTDYHFSPYVKGVASFGIYNVVGGGICAQFDLFTPESINSYVAVDNNSDIWIRCDAQWGSYLRWRFIYKDAEVTVYESADWQKTLTTIPVTHSILRPGQALRTTIGNVTATAVISSSTNRIGNLEVRTTGVAGADFRAPIFYDSNNTAYYTDPASTSNLNAVQATNYAITADTLNRFTQQRLYLRGGDPTIIFRDTDHFSGMIHVNSNLMYILRGAADSETWGAVNGQWPYLFDLSDNSATCGGIHRAILSHRSPIYYDSDNTAYYVDPASTSNLNGLTVAATITGTITNATNATTAGSATTAGTVTTAAQPSITSVGTLTSLAVSGAITAGGDITAFSGSDERLKTNILKIDNALSKVNKISGITYDWTEEALKSRKTEEELFGRRREAGVIAQEIEEVLPEVVIDRDDGYKAVRYERLVPLLIEAIKELSSQVESMKLEIEVLKK